MVLSLPTTKMARLSMRNSLISVPYWLPNEPSLWSDSILILSTPKAPHQRFCAKGRSMLTVKISTLGILAASSLNRLVCASHTGVSSEGTTLKIRTWSPVAARVTGDHAEDTHVVSGGRQGNRFQTI